MRAAVKNTFILYSRFFVVGENILNYVVVSGRTGIAQSPYGTPSSQLEVSHIDERIVLLKIDMSRQINYTG